MIKRYFALSKDSSQKTVKQTLIHKASIRVTKTSNRIQNATLCNALWHEEEIVLQRITAAQHSFAIKFYRIAR